MSILEDLEKLKNRCDVWRVLNAHGLTGCVAEIGVDEGNFAERVLEGWKGHTYFMVDLWAKQDLSVYDESDNFNFERTFQLASQCAERHSDKVKIIRKLSVDAAKEFGDNQLDWVWIDANHLYQPVLDDMNAWWRTVKNGGIFSGHDYYFPGVNKAVKEWMAEKQIKWSVSTGSWWSVK